MRQVFIALCALTGSLSGQALGTCPAGGPNRAVLDSDIAGVVLAIQDEIYAHGYARYYADLHTARLTLYVRPCRVDGSIQVIYKFLPFGELLRSASNITASNLILLLRDPTAGFPVTGGGAMPTLYLPDEEVIEMKQTWRRVSLTVLWNPSDESIRAAKEREDERARVRQGG